MLLPYRLDMAVDLFDVHFDGHTILVDEVELGRLRTAIDQAQQTSCEPHAAQMWTAVIEALGRDPRR